MNEQVVVAGVGLIAFSLPGAGEDYSMMGARAALAALRDAGLDYALVQQAYVGYAHGDSASGQAAAYRIGLTGIPIVNVNNRAASGASALFLARQAVASGAVDCALALGFDQVPVPAPLPYVGRHDPLQRYATTLAKLQGLAPEVAPAAQLFGGAARAYQHEYECRAETFALLAVKAHHHAAHNPLAVRRKRVTLEEVLASAPVFAPLTELQCSPAVDGAAAAVLCSPAFARKHGLDGRVVVIAQAMTSDRNSSFDEGDVRKLAGYDLTARAAASLYQQAAIDPRELQVVELHDSFTSNELLSYESLGLTAEGTAEQFILDEQNTYGGRVVTNPSGGLLCQGHSPGASGLAQCFELTQQLRGNAQGRQVAGARLALMHNLGLGGVCVVSLLQRL